MRTLLILRHAKSSWGDATLPDHDRPLNKRGRQAATSMGDFMRRHELLPDHVLASSAERVRETLALWQKAAGYLGRVETVRELYLADPSVYIRELNRARAPRVMCVGHNPGLEELLSLLSGASEDLPTAALAQIDFAFDNWRELAATTRGELRGVWRVKELDD